MINQLYFNKSTKKIHMDKKGIKCNKIQLPTGTNVSDWNYYKGIPGGINVEEITDNNELSNYPIYYCVDVNINDPITFSKGWDVAKIVPNNITIDNVVYNIKSPAASPFVLFRSDNTGESVVLKRLFTAEDTNELKTYNSLYSQGFAPQDYHINFKKISHSLDGEDKHYMIMKEGNGTLLEFGLEDRVNFVLPIIKAIKYLTTYNLYHTGLDPAEILCKEIYGIHKVFLGNISKYVEGSDNESLIVWDFLLLCMLILTPSDNSLHGPISKLLSYHTIDAKELHPIIKFIETVDESIIQIKNLKKLVLMWSESIQNNEFPTLDNIETDVTVAYNSGELFKLAEKTNGLLVFESSIDKEKTTFQKVNDGVKVIEYLKSVRPFTNEKVCTLLKNHILNTINNGTDIEKQVYNSQILKGDPFLKS